MRPVKVYKVRPSNLILFHSVKRKFGDHWQYDDYYFIRRGVNLFYVITAHLETGTGEIRGVSSIHEEGTLSSRT